MKEWMKTAKRDMREMRSLASALPLMESLQTAFATINKTRAMITVEGDGVVLDAMSNPTTASDKKILEAIAVLHSGSRMRIRTDERTSYFGQRMDDEFMPERLYTTGSGKIASIDSMAGSSSQVKRECFTEINGLIEEEISKAASVSPPVPDGMCEDWRPARKMLGRSRDKAIDITIAKRTLEDLSKILSAEDVMSLIRLCDEGVARVRRFAHIERILGNEQNGRRSGYFCEMVSIASPKGMKEMRKGLEEGRHGRFEPSPAIIPPEACRTPSRREAAEDESIIRTEFPNLHKKLMRPDASEQRLRALKNMAHRLARMGMDYPFIARAIDAGDRSEDGIINQYLGSHDGRRIVKRNKERPKMAFRGEVKASEAPEAKAGPSSVRTKEEFLSSIALSEEASAFIIAKGFTPADIVFAICKGFEFGKGMNCTSGAVGNSHYRGVHVRNNIRRYLQKRYEGSGVRPPETDKLLDFLKSIDLLREFGSGPTTKTKDDAMSINTDPRHRIGQDILRTMNSAFVQLRKNGSDKPPPETVA